MKKFDILAMYLVATTVVALAAIAHAQQPLAQPDLAPQPRLIFPTQFVEGANAPAQGAIVPGQPEFADPAPGGDEASVLPGPLQIQVDQPELAAGGLPRGEMGVWLVASGGAGVEIRRVSDGGAAARAGIRPGDVILQVNGQGARTPHGVSQLIRSMPPGEVVSVNVWRDGTLQEFSVALEPMRAPSPTMPREPYQASFRGEATADVAATSASSGDIASRTERLEEQLTMVMKELQQMRQEMTQLRAGSTLQTAADTGLSQPASDAESATDPGFGAIDEAAAPPEAAVPALPAAEPSAAEAAATPPVPSEFEAIEEPAAEPAAEATSAEEPAAAATEEPAAESPAEPDADSDPFADEPEAAAEPAEEELPGAEAEPAAETESDAEDETLFE